MTLLAFRAMFAFDLICAFCSNLSQRHSHEPYHQVQRAISSICKDGLKAEAERSASPLTQQLLAEEASNVTELSPVSLQMGFDVLVPISRLPAAPKLSMK